MYHFTSTEHVSETTALNKDTELSGRAIRFLKDFQISAVRFILEHFNKHEFCILNDESGLGKTATVAGCLGIVANQKNCLIVVSNEDAHEKDWRFHLDVLTDLNVSVLKTEQDYKKNSSNIYIVKWNTLRTIGEINKMKFDLIVLDNRNQMLNNTFCISTLLNNFEKKVQLVISSVDITSDVKLMHNILRLGGHLEHNLQSFRAFENKFKLPDLKSISTKQSDLEEYFLKREILNDYCRDFRLRRYRHQFESVFPLVTPDRYNTFLLEWLNTVGKAQQTGTAILEGSLLPSELNTEELIETFSRLKSNHHHITTPLDVIDDQMEMSPLMLFTDSENENEEKNEDGDKDEDEVILLSSENTDTVAINNNNQIIEIEDEIAEEVVEHTEETITDTSKSVDKKETNICDANLEKDKRKRRKSTPKKVQLKNSSSYDTPRTRSVKGNNQKCPIGKGKRSNVELMPTNENVRTVEVSPKKKKVDKELNAGSGKNESPSSSPKKNDSIKNCENKKVSNNLKVNKKSSTVPKGEEKEETETKAPQPEICTRSAKNDSPTIRARKRKSRAATTNIIVNEPVRTRRATQRMTRSSAGKLKFVELNLNLDKKVKVKKNLQQKKDVKKSSKNCKQKTSSSTTNTKTTEKHEFNQKTGKESTKKQRNIELDMDRDRVQSQCKNLELVNEKSLEASPQTSTLNFIENSALPTSSEYEEIQCGQKLLSSNTDSTDSPQFLANNEVFVMPATPQLFENLQCSLLQSQIYPSKNIDNDSDLAILMTSNPNNVPESVILISSSHDEASLSSQSSLDPPTRSTEKRKLRSKRPRERLTFNNLLSKKRDLAKSPDLFSTGSEVSGTLSKQINGEKRKTIMTSISPTFGFKIFGSEVRSLEETTITDNGVNMPRTSRASRSCLNLLEKMVERNTIVKPVDSRVGQNKTGTEILKLATRRKSSTLEIQTPKDTSPKTVIGRRSTIHEDRPLEINDSEDIFEITNNATFGSTLRINANGNISPVRQLTQIHTQTQHPNHNNKITNYLIGNSNVRNQNICDEQIFGTPSKRLQPVLGQTLPDSGNRNEVHIGTQSFSRKSPKSGKSTQNTKLTKWFRRSSVDEASFHADQGDVIDISKSAKIVKRRRLDLSKM